MVRFIHAADLHLDRSFEGLNKLGLEKVKELVSVNQKVFENIVTAALQQQVDFLLLAGDTFHQNKPSLKVQHHFMELLERLAQGEIPVYLIFGNHDYYQGERYWFSFPSNVRLFATEEVTTITGKTKSGASYAITGFSYLHPWIKENKLAEFPLKGEVDYQIGLYHGDSQDPHFAPFSLNELKAKNYDYWAFGHIHVPTVVSEKPPVIYPGTPQGHTKKEHEIAGVELVTLEQGHVQRETLSVAEIYWEKAKISLADCRQQAQVLRKLTRFLADYSREATLLSLALEDTDALGRDFFESIATNELVSYLNDYLQQQGHPVTVHELLLTAKKAPINLPVSRELAETVLANYQNQATFEQITRELIFHPIFRQAADAEVFQSEVLRAGRELLARDFAWGGVEE